MSLYDAARLGRTLLALGRPQDAERILRAALLHAPHDPALLRVLAQAMYEQRRYSEARETANRSVAAESNNAIGLMQLSAAESGCGNQPAARSASRPRTPERIASWAPFC